MSRPAPSPKPVEEPEDWAAFRRLELMVKAGHEYRDEREMRDIESGRYVW